MPRRRRSKKRSRAPNTDVEKEDRAAAASEIELTKPSDVKVSGTGRRRGRPRKKQAPETRDEPRQTTRTRSSPRAKQCHSCIEERGNASSTRLLRIRGNRIVYTDVSSSSEESDHHFVPANSPAQKVNRKPSFVRPIIHSSAIDRVVERSLSKSSSSEGLNLHLSDGESSYGESVRGDTASFQGSNHKNPSPTSTTENFSSQSTSRGFIQSNSPIPVIQTSTSQSVSTSVPSPTRTPPLADPPLSQTPEDRNGPSSTSNSENVGQQIVEDGEYTETKLNIRDKIEPEMEIVFVSEFVHDLYQPLLRTKFRFKVYVESKNAIANDGVEIRIMDIDLNGQSMFECMCNELRSKFTHLVKNKFTIYWRDSENDAITVTDCSELETALKVMQNNPVVKFYVVLDTHVNYTSSD